MEAILRDIVKFFNKKKRIKQKGFVQEAWMHYGINDLPDLPDFIASSCFPGVLQVMEPLSWLGMPDRSKI